MSTGPLVVFNDPMPFILILLIFLLEFTSICPMLLGCLRAFPFLVEDNPCAVLSLEISVEFNRLRPFLTFFTILPLGNFLLELLIFSGTAIAGGPIGLMPLLDMGRARLTSPPLKSMAPFSFLFLTSLVN